MNVLLAHAGRSARVADLLHGAADVTIAELAVGEVPIAEGAAVARARHHVLLTLAGAGQRVALQVPIEYTLRIAVALLAADDLSSKEFHISHSLSIGAYYGDFLSIKPF